MRIERLKGRERDRPTILNTRTREEVGGRERPYLSAPTTGATAPGAGSREEAIFRREIEKITRQSHMVERVNISEVSRRDRFTIQNENFFSGMNKFRQESHSGRPAADDTEVIMGERMDDMFNIGHQ